MAISVTNNTNVPSCAKACLFLKSKICRSFTYSPSTQQCVLYEVYENNVNMLTRTTTNQTWKVIRFDLISYFGEYGICLFACVSACLKTAKGRVFLDCNGVSTRPQLLRQEFGSIKSPQWPNDFPRHSICSWRLAAPPGKQTLIKVTHFDLGNRQKECSNETASVAIIPDNDNSRARKYCKTDELLKDFELFEKLNYSKFVDIVFHSRSSKSSGFQIFYRTGGLSFNITIVCDE